MHTLAIAGLVLATGSFVVLCVVPTLMVATRGPRWTPASLPLLLPAGVKAKPVTLSASDAALLNSRPFDVVDICQAFGVPPPMLDGLGGHLRRNASEPFRLSSWQSEQIQVALFDAVRSGAFKSRSPDRLVAELVRACERLSLLTRSAGA